MAVGGQKKTFLVRTGSLVLYFYCFDSFLGIDQYGKIVEYWGYKHSP